METPCQEHGERITRNEECVKGVKRVLDEVRTDVKDLNLRLGRETDAIKKRLFWMAIAIVLALVVGGVASGQLANALAVAKLLIAAP